MKRIIVLLLLMVFILASQELQAQCAMCTAVADEAMKQGSSQGAGINKAVLYMFLMPYLIVATIGFIWWRKQVKAKREENV
ncbi:MAG: hypothetical protein JNL95_07470 [Chitinophagales bacterium]|nr:hypothetical protein [Chitinophagales bacterium]